MKEKLKLEIVKSNKTLQKNLDIGIINYKYFSGKYIIYESDGNVKEYDYGDKLLYEGEYLNGKRNGKGKEYDFYGKLFFEGEYLNGKRNGKGKEYYDNGKGEFFNDKEIIGTRYEQYGSIIYKISNNINEVEKEFDFYNDQINFEGEYLNGKRNGKGKEYYGNGQIKFEGEYLNDKRWNGKVYDPSNNQVYELKNGKGFLKEYMFDKLSFEGEYVNGERNGKGKDYFCGELIFEGEYLNGKRNGKGKEYEGYNKLKFEGEYLEGRKIGKGKEYYGWCNKLKFEGEYLYDFKLKGKYYLYQQLEYEGEYFEKDMIKMVILYMN